MREHIYVYSFMKELCLELSYVHLGTLPEAVKFTLSRFSDPDHNIRRQVLRSSHEGSHDGQSRWHGHGAGAAVPSDPVAALASATPP